VEIEVLVDKAAKWGLKPGDVRRAAATLVAATVAGYLFENQRVYEVVVWGVPQVRQDLDTIRNLRIDAPAGGPGGGPTQVRLADVADVRVVAKPEVILHDQVSRAIDVVANVRGRGIGAVTAEVRDRLRQVTFPPEHHLEVLGETQARASAGFELWAVVIGLAIFVFFLLQAAFGSWRLALLYYLLLPLALVGGLLLALTVRGSLSTVALLGLLTVLAVAVRGGLLQVRHYQRLADEALAPAEAGAGPDEALAPAEAGAGPAEALAPAEAEANPDEALAPAEAGASPADGVPHGLDLVVRGSRDRFLPTVTATLAAGLALLPLVVLGGRSGMEIVGPLALVVLGGLVTSAVLNLAVLPTLYLRFAARPQPEPPAA
jgi:Cu/Ag efflux pump CusA